ncbi:hypothetical protein [Synechocystis sp. PCC 7509]|uniref:hypothetical protein n=1 Tax=Synechocystis sp. PCC 7509 TaxID=927677 RepID=UPI0002ACB7AF|nr:hypothetical protein [Synechocystis sp. PCC 7509]
MKMLSIRSFCLVSCNFFIVGGLISCNGLGNSSFNGINFRNVTEIRNIKLPNKQGTVYLQGRITNIVPLSEPWQAYQMQDSSGTIWAITSLKGLKIQDKLVIKGNLRYQSIPVATQELGDFYVEEQERLEHTPAVQL